MKQIAVDSSMKRLSTKALPLQIGCAESQLASCLLVLSFYEESLGGRGFATVCLRSRYKRRWIELVESYLLIFDIPLREVPRKNW